MRDSSTRWLAELDYRVNSPQSMIDRPINIRPRQHRGLIISLARPLSETQIVLETIQFLFQKRPETLMTTTHIPHKSNYNIRNGFPRGFFSLVPPKPSRIAEELEKKKYIYIYIFSCIDVDA